MLLLVGLLVLQSAWLHRAEAKPLQGIGWWPLARLGFRNASSRPGRSVLCIALIASAAFIIVAVDAFRHREGTATLERKSGSGGFPLLAEACSIVMIPARRPALKLAIPTMLRLRLRVYFRAFPSTAARCSCLNLPAGYPKKSRRAQLSRATLASRVVEPTGKNKSIPGYGSIAICDGAGLYCDAKSGLRLNGSRVQLSCVRRTLVSWPRSPTVCAK